MVVVGHEQAGGAGRAALERPKDQHRRKEGDDRQVLEELEEATPALGALVDLLLGFGDGLLGLVLLVDADDGRGFGQNHLVGVGWLGEGARKRDGEQGRHGRRGSRLARPSLADRLIGDIVKLRQVKRLVLVRGLVILHGNPPDGVPRCSIPRFAYQRSDRQVMDPSILRNSLISSSMTW